MLELIVVSIIIFLLVLVTEILWRSKHYSNELTRKFIHISLGTFAAFWPWFLSWNQIYILAGGAFALLLISRSLTIFKTLHIINRKSFGELFSVLAIGITALTTHNRYIFMAAMLNLSLADGLAAVVGSQAPKGWQYRVFGQRKSLPGTLAFLICSIGILLAYSFVAPHPSPFVLLLPVAGVACLVENIGIWGSDNVLIPLTVAVLLSLY